MCGTVAGTQSYIGASDSSIASRNAIPLAFRGSCSGVTARPVRAQIPVILGTVEEAAGAWAPSPTRRYPATPARTTATAAASSARLTKALVPVRLIALSPRPTPAGPVPALSLLASRGARRRGQWCARRELRRTLAIATNLHRLPPERGLLHPGDD